MRLKVQHQKDGLHPSEVIVTVKTSSGIPENLVVHRRSLSDGSLEIGYPISEDSDSYLVELPRETATGAWRVWVPSASVVASGSEH